MADFQNILIANRGEIAVRICETAKSLGYKTTAVYSEADRSARHVRVADQAVYIGESPVTSSYLNIPNILEAAERTGADAIHPGYGFLAENEDFAQACLDQGLTFIGPSPEAIRIMGNKQTAKAFLQKAAIPCIPGYHGEDQTDTRLIRESESIGYPVMVKAVYGGGGKGMRLVSQKEELVEALRSARSEALNAFGNDALMLEKAITHARHVEIQIFADFNGNTIHLGERDCSIQRRHQKVVEESPSPAVDEELRNKMGQVAVDVAKAVYYHGAGTVEFLLAPSGEFYFLEMNTRLQVEHPVTEMVTGLDLVKLQLQVAAGLPLGITQDQVKLTGQAVEVRLYAEDPEQSFLPQTGQVLSWKEPGGDGIRTDHALVEGDQISPFYDPMLAKVIAHGEDRDMAVRRLKKAISEMVFLGVKSNQGFLLDVLSHPQFANGSADTGFIEQYFPTADLQPDSQYRDQAFLVTALIAYNSSSQQPTHSELRNWRSANSMENTYRLQFGETKSEVIVESIGPDLYKVKIKAKTHNVILLELVKNSIRLEVDGIQNQIEFALSKESVFLKLYGRQFVLKDITLALPDTLETLGQGTATAVMDGAIVDVRVEKGQPVKKGDILVVMEAMKMELPILAGISGKISSINLELGQQVKAKQVLVEISES